MGIHTVEECPHVLQFTHMIMGGSSRSTDFIIDFLTKTLFDIWVLRQHVEREGQERHSLSLKINGMKNGLNRYLTYCVTSSDEKVNKLDQCSDRNAYIARKSNHLVFQDSLI